MKRSILWMVIVSMGVCSCKKDFLLRLPQDTLSTQTYYSNGDNLPSALLGVYNALQADNFWGRMPELDGVSDNGAIFKYETELISYGQGIASANVSQKLAGYYQYAYQLIQRANILLDNINAPGSLSNAQRKSIAAEAKALRAIAYMRLVYLYGAVPYFTTYKNLTDINALSRSSRDSVVAGILQELRSAGDSLGTTPYGGQKGRLTKQAVLGMRAKVLLFEARLGKMPWASAQAALAEVMQVAESSGAGLLTSATPGNGQSNYAAVFTAANVDNKEVLFAVENSNLGRATNLYTYFGAGGGNLYMAVHTNFVNDFYCTDGLPIGSSPLYKPDSPYTNRDPRLKATITTPGDTYSTGTALLPFNGKVTIGVLPTNYAVKKYTTLDGLTQNLGQLDEIVLRYADVLLLFAEAENQVNGPSAAAYTAINRVRARVLMPNVAPGLTQAAFNQEVIHERRIELGFEGQRWFDLVTLGIAGAKINAIGELGRAFVANKQELFPIPQSEIDLNPHLTQNPGY